jgi:hypothetical protein
VFEMALTNSLILCTERIHLHCFFFRGYFLLAVLSVICGYTIYDKLSLNYFMLCIF